MTASRQPKADGSGAYRQGAVRVWVLLFVFLILVISITAYLLSPRHPVRRSEEVPSHYIRSAGYQRVIAFVHGIFGNARDTWTCQSGLYWPELLLTDNAFEKTDVYVVGYKTPYFGNQMTIDEIVGNIKNRLLHDQVLTSHQEVVFVCHSLGGLIVQRLLLTHREYASKVPFIYFYGTPETGAQIAALGRIFTADPLLKNMLSGNENDYLLNLETEWKAAQFKIFRYCAYEKRPLHGILVVDRLSSTRNCDSLVAINEDHSTIVKPCSRNEDSYIALRNAVINMPVASPPIGVRSFTSHAPIHKRDVRIGGLVSDEETGEPLTDVRITLPELNLAVLSDAQGHFVATARGPSAERVLLMAQKDGYETYRTKATVGNTNLGFVMRKKL